MDAAKSALQDPKSSVSLAVGKVKPIREIIDHKLENLKDQSRPFFSARFPCTPFPPSSFLVLIPSPSPFSPPSGIRSTVAIVASLAQATELLRRRVLSVSDAALHPLQSRDQLLARLDELIVRTKDYVSSLPVRLFFCVLPRSSCFVLSSLVLSALSSSRRSSKRKTMLRVFSKTHARLSPLC